MIDSISYCDYPLLEKAAKIVEQEAIDYLPLLDKVVDNDDSHDLTGVHPRDRTDVNLHCGLLLGDGVTEYKDTLIKKFQKSLNYAKTLSGVVKIELIAIGPNSVVPTHLDDMSRPQFDNNNDWYSVFIGVVVPSIDLRMIGVQVGNEIYNHMCGKAIVFDTQIPHSAYNNTDQWWLSLRLSILKEKFRG